MGDQLRTTARTRALAPAQRQSPLRSRREGGNSMLSRPSGGRPAAEPWLRTPGAVRCPSQLADVSRIARRLPGAEPRSANGATADRQRHQDRFALHGRRGRVSSGGSASVSSSPGPSLTSDRRSPTEEIRGHSSRRDPRCHSTRRRPGRWDRVGIVGLVRLEPEKGLEPLTCSLRVSCSAV